MAFNPRNLDYEPAPVVIQISKVKKTYSYLLFKHATILSGFALSLLVLVAQGKADKKGKGLS